LVGVGLIGLVAKLHKWDESALFFDGTCLGAFNFCTSSIVGLTRFCSDVCVWNCSVSDGDDTIIANDSNGGGAS
jgi:hypothetical protein